MRRTDWLLLPMVLVILLIFSSLLGAQQYVGPPYGTYGDSTTPEQYLALMNRNPPAPATPAPFLQPRGPLVSAQPGYWLNSGFNAPCPQTAPGIHPFAVWTDPALGVQLYFGGDVNANQPHPQLYGTYIDAIYYNHTRAYYDQQGFITPMYPQNGPGNFYPAPSSASGLCVQFATFPGNTATCPVGTPAVYSTHFASNPVWTQSLAFYQPQIQAACSGPQPTLTPTRTATPPAPTPTPTPSQGDPTMTVYIEAITAAGITNGCGNGKFCGTSTITRQEVAVWLAKAMKLPLLSCKGIYTDAPCPTPTPVPQHILVHQ